MKHLLSCLLAVTAGCFFSPHLLRAAPAAKPNVILILTNDLGWSDIGCYGSEIQTPNIDRLATRSVVFTRTN